MPGFGARPLPTATPSAGKNSRSRSAARARRRTTRTSFASTPTSSTVTPSIDVVVPVHNGWELTKSCLEHLSAQTLSHAVVVLDNGSTDGTPARLRDAFPDVKIVELGANLGFPVACNRGVQTGAGEIVVLLNNDVDCRPDFLERLVSPFRDEGRLGSVAALLLTPAEDRIESFGLTVDPTLAGYPRLRGSPPGDAQVSDPVLLGPSGAAGAYRRRPARKRDHAGRS